MQFPSLTVYAIIALFCLMSCMVGYLIGTIVWDGIHTKKKWKGNFSLVFADGYKTKLSSNTEHPIVQNRSSLVQVVLHDTHPGYLPAVEIRMDTSTPSSYFQHHEENGDLLLTLHDPFLLSPEHTTEVLLWFGIEPNLWTNELIEMCAPENEH